MVLAFKSHNGFSASVFSLICELEINSEKIMNLLTT